MTDLRTGLLAACELGPEALFYQARYRLALAGGWVRRSTLASTWERLSLAGLLVDGVPGTPQAYAEFRRAHPQLRFFFDADRPGLPWQAGGGAPRELLEEADEIRTGRFRLFGGAPVDLGISPDWHTMPPPLGGEPRFESDVHWTQVALDRPGRDARLAWELSRFGWLTTLARAYRWTGQEAYAEVGWRLVESWRSANLPNRGVHWSSAQEAGFRILALAFAERAFLPVWRSHPDRGAALAEMVAAHADRIVPSLDYARAQGNNHLLSEGAGLLTAGLLYPELRRSRRWLKLGRRALEGGFARQVYPDGGYVQHSANYHRLALILGVWSVRLAKLNGMPLSESLSAAVVRLAKGLAAQVGPQSGRMASFGPNDGSLVLRLACSDPDDARPELEAAARLFEGASWFGDGPWDETARWLDGGEAPRVSPPMPPSLPDAGLHFLRGPSTRGTLRCARFHGRPGHSDQLHVDLWWGDALIAVDPGSYLYNGPAPWQGALAEAAVHNAPLFDGREPMHRAGRFLWVDRAQGKIDARWERVGLQAIQAEHDGYRKLGVRLARSLGLVDGRAWLVVDQALGRGEGRLMVGWNLPDAPWEILADGLRLTLPQGALDVGWDGDGLRVGVARGGAWVSGQAIAGPIGLWGWRSPRYAAIEPCLRLVLEARGPMPLRVRTRFLPGQTPSPMLERLWQDASELAPEPSP